MSQQILDSNIITNQSIIQKFKWWEKKRMLFNIAVGISGLITTIMYCKHFEIFELFGVIAWGMVANILYSTGFIFEMVDHYYFNERIQIVKFRMFLFLIGTLSYIIVSYFFGMVYYLFS